MTTGPVGRRASTRGVGATSSCRYRESRNKARSPVAARLRPALPDQAQAGLFQNASAVEDVVGAGPGAEQGRNLRHPLFDRVAHLLVSRLPLEGEVELVREVLIRRVALAEEDGFEPVHLLVPRVDQDLPEILVNGLVVVDDQDASIQRTDL